MNRITPDHLARSAYVYVRQSTTDQLLNNPESRRRQYDLVTRARSLGWQSVVVIDDDLGRSGGGQAPPGFSIVDARSALAREQADTTDVNPNKRLPSNFEKPPQAVSTAVTEGPR